MDYLEKVYFPFHEQWAEFAVIHHRNFGIRSTSRAEGTHSTLKQQLQTRQAHLDQFHQTIRDVSDQSEILYKQKLRRQRDQRLTSPPLVKIYLFRRLHGQISHYALKRVYQEYEKAKKAWDRDPSGDSLPICNKVLGRQFGLPCQHLIFPLLQQVPGQPAGELELHHIDAHWWLHREGPLTDDEVRRLNEPDPLVIARRQRNNNGPKAPAPPAAAATASRPAIRECIVVGGGVPRRDNSVRRDPSHDEAGGGILQRWNAAAAPLSSAPARLRR